MNSVLIATTAALGVAGLVREADPLFTLDLAGFGASGNRAEAIYEFNPAAWNLPNVQQPGELLVISNPVVMDAAGTFQLAVTVHWREEAPGL